MLDHLVYVVADLQAAVARFASAGLLFSPGGRHTARGTHNALLRLGPRSYLEVLAVDPTTDLPAPRWMGIDLGTLPRLSRWALHAGAKDFPTEDWQQGTRILADGRALHWRLTDPGSAPATEVVPFLIDWSGSTTHPAEALPDAGVELVDLRLYSPDEHTVNQTLQRYGAGQRAVQAASPRIAATVRGPIGLVRL
ncbi:hypothetical protein LEM8419_01716 [Neolewinella maritima]|uniref:Glyoxalase-like domain-containing protein n=1 Tax=Neolewinella maritima TaxID=1383882 RepID=A0ABM9B0M1_9BACT|nr:VOC family protein [Neolewinella maritima]CAH1000582.1 hypothetical protein LEM8419_01716 [Neolewinella maritima]